MGDRVLQNVLAAVIIILAILALVFQDRIEDWWQELSLSKDDRPVIANIVTMTNKVKYRLPESLNYHRAKESMGLHAKDTVSTEDGSRAIIKFKSGLEVLLQPNSLVIIENYGNGPGAMELSFLRGNIRVLHQAPAIKLGGTQLKKENLINSKSLSLDLSMLEKAPTPPPTVVPKVNLEEKHEKQKVVEKKKIEDKETLPDNYISSVIRSQRTFLNRCYAQHLRLNPDARGRIDTSLTIESDGSVSTARVIGSTIADPVLQQCVVTTLQRAHFRSYNGDPMIVNYPINFD